ncbi:protein FAM71A [Carlito syrichta]|uniref:Protein FAM71A n=1 Tax=Carlito syrichta TaxID=1868482 RepID=A0A1U7USM9_CARSF|nr:protein FAM71A [Carlito syrichta]
MSCESLLPYYTAQSGSGVGMFHTTMGKLQRQLHKGEYDIFKYAPIFESDFIQITKRGEVIDVHNRVRMVTVGIACTSPILPLPDVMLLARPATGCEEHAGRGQARKKRSRKTAKALELTRLLPLKFVRISVHDRKKQQLRLKFATGRSCYLLLCPPLDAREDLFSYWEKLIYLLRPPMESNSSTYATPVEDMVCMPVFDEDRASLGAADFQGKRDQDQVSIRSLHMVSEVRGATSAAYAGGEGIQHDSHKPTNTPDVSTPNPKSTELAKESATGAVADTSSTVATKPAPGQACAATEGEATTGARGSQSHLTVADTANMSPKSTKVFAEASKASERISNTSTSLSPEANMTVVIAETISKAVEEIGDDVDALTGPPLSTAPSKSSMSRRSGRQRPQANAEAHKERRERREKDRALGRSSHHRRKGESRHRTRKDKAARKLSNRSLSGHRAGRDDIKEKGRGSPGGSRHKGVSHTLITKESRTSHKSGRSLSVTSSGSSKRLSRISSFLRNVRANFTTKAAGSTRDPNVEITTKVVERSTMEAITETAENAQGMEMVGSVTSEIKETMTFEAH